MALFAHSHRWRRMDSYTMIRAGKDVGEMKIQQCSCGAVRSITITPGEPPVIAMAVDAPPKETGS